MSDLDIVDRLNVVAKGLRAFEYNITARDCEDAAAEITALRKRLAGLEGVVAAHEFARSSIRVFWSFGSDQHHTHNYHSREDFVALWDARVRAAAEKGGAK